MATTYNKTKDVVLTQAQFDAKQTAGTLQTGVAYKIKGTLPTYTAGTNVQITDGVISATDTTYTAGTGISIENGVISTISNVSSSDSSGGGLYTHKINMIVNNEDVQTELIFIVLNSNISQITSYESVINYVGKMYSVIGKYSKSDWMADDNDWTAAINIYRGIIYVENSTIYIDGYDTITSKFISHNVIFTNSTSITITDTVAAL